MDGDPTTGGVQVVVEDVEDDNLEDLIKEISFDVTITVPVGAEDSTGPVIANTFSLGTDVPVTARFSDFLPAGTAAFAATGWTQADATKKPREWTATLIITITAVVDDGDETGTTSDQKAIAARDAALKKGIFVDVMTDADLIQTTGLVGGPMEDRGSLAAEATFRVISLAVDEKEDDVEFCTLRCAKSYRPVCYYLYICY